MKLNEVKSLLTELRGLSAEELATREQDLKKNCSTCVSKQLLVSLKTLSASTKLRKTIARVKTVQREAK
jgi:large subunit ribosomal protein L29